MPNVEWRLKAPNLVHREWPIKLSFNGQSERLLPAKQQQTDKTASAMEAMVLFEAFDSDDNDEMRNGTVAMIGPPIELVRLARKRSVVDFQA